MWNNLALGVSTRLGEGYTDSYNITIGVRPQVNWLLLGALGLGALLLLTRRGPKVVVMKG